APHVAERRPVRPRPHFGVLHALHQPALPGPRLHAPHHGAHSGPRLRGGVQGGLPLPRPRLHKRL
ncbi:hypothetical protein MNEG_13278, partial [Monoraphidium neglectum]